MALPSLPRSLAVLISITLASLVGLALRRPDWRLGDTIQAISYDSLHSFAPPLPDGAAAGSNVIIVYLDLHSYLLEKQDPSQPWPRDLHAQLIRRLMNAGAATIVFDILFAGPGPDARADLALASAIAESGRVILAGQAAQGGTRPSQVPQLAGRWLEIEEPWPLLASGAVAWGLANHLVEDDFVIRRQFPGIRSQARSSLAWTVAERRKGPANLDREAAIENRNRWIRYYGPPLSLPHVSYTQALRPNEVSDDLFRDRIVLVGARPMAGLFLERQDHFRSPFHSWRNPDRFIPGVEVHATELLNLLRDDGLRRPTDSQEILLLLVIASLGGLGIFQARPAAATATAFALALAVPIGATVAFRHGIWFPWLIASGAQIPLLLAGSWLAHFRDWHVTRRRLETERRAAEARIREQAALIDKANDAIFVRDLDGTVLYRNPAAERLYGLRHVPIARDTGEHRLFDAESCHAARSATLTHGEWRGELHHHNRSGQPLVVESRWTLIRDEQGQPKSFLIMDNNVTEQRQLEAESLRLQRAEAIGALASGMAHDLNNALAPVLLGTQILARSATTDETRRVLALMEAGTRRGVEMVRQVLLFARGGPGERRPLSLEPLLREMERLARTTFPRNITVTLHAPHGLWSVLGNPTELHQVLLNLCVNARDAMPQGGSLHLSIENLTLDSEAAATLPGSHPADYVYLLIADSGCGIPADTLPRIFEPFFTTKPEGVGTGLGLSTTARIVRAHGGFIHVTSTPGEGTSFEIYLPRLLVPAPPANELSEKPAPRGRGECLLVADDDLAVLEVLSRGLTDHGYRVIAATGGAEAVASFAEHRDRIDAVICDLAMPGLDGAEASASIRRMNPEVPWLFMSGGAPKPPSANECSADFLPKPVALETLLLRVRETLDRRGASPS